MATSFITVLVVMVAVLSFLFGAWLGRFLTRYPFGRKPYAGTESLPGRIGVVKRVWSETAEVSIDGEIWIADLNEQIGTINPGDQVVVRSVEGLKLRVKKLS